MKKVFVVIVLVFNLLFPQVIKADVKLPAIVSSNMVLQRNTTITLWGWADAGEKIAINVSWLKESINIEADKQGNWRIEVKTNNSKESQTIKIKSISSTIFLENILFGEVWLCSGQSNMGMKMKGNPGQPIFGSNSALVKANNPNLRLFTVDRVGSKIPQKNIEKFIAWQQASPESVLEFSAVAYYFGQQLQEFLDCPVGLIHTSWGGSTVQAWMSKEAMHPFKTVTLDNIDITKQTNYIPTALFNAMIHPLISYTIKGALWYQGESNHKEPEKYKKLFPAMVKDWRAKWRLGDFPFLYVQIAPFSYKNREAFQTVDNSAFMREAQLQCLDLIPNSGIAITMDLGDENSIHPPKKKEVADRLLFSAIDMAYGFHSIDGKSPIYESHEIKDNGIFLSFKNAEIGLYTYDTLIGFEIAGEDKVFHPAKAKIINGKKVFVISEKVPNPLAIRYAWQNWTIGTLYDTNLLPASSFRTDQWDDAKKAEN
jgi:sialate O-acetylesterase